MADWLNGGMANWLNGGLAEQMKPLLLTDKLETLATKLAASVRKEDENTQSGDKERLLQLAQNTCTFSVKTPHLFFKQRTVNK